MLLKKITKISQVLALMAMVFGTGAFYQTNGAVAGSSAAAFDDDDDKRGKKQDKRGDQGKRGGQDKRDDRGDRGNRGRDSQRDSDREARRQQEQSDRNSRQQQRQSDHNSRRQQESSDRDSQRQQWESDRNSRRQQADSDRRSRQQNNWGDGRSGGGRRVIEDNRYRNDRRRNDDRRAVDAAPGVFFAQTWNVVPQYRIDNRRAIRDQQKFFKEQLKAQRRYQRDQQRYSAYQYRNYPAPVYRYDNNYYSNQSDYNRGTSWRGQILPMLIANIFGGGSNSYNTGFPQDRYARTNVDPYEYQYRQPTYAPAYTYGPTYDNSYNNYGYSDPYSYNPQGFDTGSVLSSLPIAEIISQYTGQNEFVSGLIGTFLSQGYDQGLMAGQNARQYGYTEAQYNDPYTNQNGAYDPYSVSLGENRRYLSEGYEQGYRDGYDQGQRDAVYGGENYDQTNAGGSDLIGVLLNSVLSNV